jgi:spermidine synthase
MASASPPAQVKLGSPVDATQAPTAALAAIFFCSGTSALIYQVLWLRILGWVFGVTVYAASTVWASFMAGLAVGSAGAGSVGDRLRRPLFWVGCAECLIAATAVSTPTIFHAIERVYIRVYPELPHSLGALTAIRFVISFVVLFVPTAMMGATLPLMMKSGEARGGQWGAKMAALYASNTAGAIVGTLAAGLYLIPQIGIRATFLVAAAVNVAAGGSAIVLSRYVRPKRPDRIHLHTSAQPAALDSLSDDPERRCRAVVLVVFVLSGFASLALEVVWFRVLTLFLRPTVYGFAVMLATILAGIAAGSYLVMPLLHRRIRWVSVLALIEMALGVAVVLSFRPLVELQAFADWLTPIVSRIASGWLGYQVAGSLLAIFPSSLLMGVAFPIGLQLWTGKAGDGGAIAQRTGQFYSLNVAAAIVGSLVGGFLMLPVLGSRTSLILLAAVSLGSGVALIAVSEWRRRSRLIGAVVGTALFAAAVWWSPNPFDEFVRARYPRDTIVWKQEGIDSTVVVLESPSHDLALTVRGNHQASTDQVTTYVHRRIGHLPMVLHPDPRSALVIGLGGGATAGAVSIHGAEVDLVELAGAVVDAAPFFERISYGVLQRPNVHLRIDDGRNYLMLTPRRYDVITADVIHPIFAGSANLYSVEYFRSMRRVLNPGGMVVQWVAGTEEEYKIIARTFLSVFPETTVWGGGSLLVGKMEPLELRRSDFDRKRNAPGRAEALRDLNINSFDALLGAFDAGPDALRRFVGDGPLLTDDKPVVEYFLSLPRERDVDTSSLKSDVRRYVAER